MSNVTFRFAGDQALLVEFENEISIAVNQKVRSLKEALEKEHLAGLGELVPAYRSLLIHYDPMVIAYRQLMEKVEQYANHLSNVELPPAIVTEIPVCYEGEYAADIRLTAAFPEGGAEMFSARLTELSAGALFMEEAGEELLPGPRREIS